jgi:hypothetical protein
VIRFVTRLCGCARYSLTQKRKRREIKDPEQKSTTPRAEQPPRTVRSHLNQSQGWGVCPNLWPQKSKPSERGKPYIHLHRQNRHRSAYETGREGHILWALQPTAEPAASKAARRFARYSRLSVRSYVEEPTRLEAIS